MTTPTKDQLVAILREAIRGVLDHTPTSVSEGNYLDAIDALEATAHIAEEQASVQEPQKPFLYGIQDRDGNPYLSEQCVGENASDIFSEVEDANNDYPEGEDQFKVVPLFTHPSQDALDAARYRFLRDENNWNDELDETWTLLTEVSFSEFDALIDAAIAQSKEAKPCPTE
jgi:hypothetical protein